jgi:hypothetical protein
VPRQQSRQVKPKLSVMNIQKAPFEGGLLNGGGT